MEADAQPTRPEGGDEPSEPLLIEVGREVERDDRRVAALNTETFPEPVGKVKIVVVDRFHTDLFDQFQGRERADPGQPGGGHVETASGARQPERGAVDALPRIIPGVPPGVQGRHRVDHPLADGHERRAARAEQPLVGTHHHHVVVGGIERQPPGGLSGIGHGDGVDRSRRRPHGLQVGHRTVRRLHDAEGDHDGVGVDRIRQLLQWDHHHVEVGTGEEREEHTGELPLRSDHPRAGCQRRRRMSDERRHLSADRHALRRRRDQPGEHPASSFDDAVIRRRPGSAVLPVIDRRPHGVDRALGRQPDAGGVEIPGGARELC